MTNNRYLLLELVTIFGGLTIGHLEEVVIWLKILSMSLSIVVAMITIIRFLKKPL